MKRLVIIFILWAGMIGSAVAGPPVYDYVPKSIGMDFSTAPKPHIPVPGGEWHVISGDGTIYPDIINYCDPETSPECLGHLYVACWAWTAFEANEIGGTRHPTICDEAGFRNDDAPSDPLSRFEPFDVRPSTLYYYKLDKWNLKEMGYYFWNRRYPPAFLEDFPFEKNTDPDKWRGEWAIDIYSGYCKPDDACFVNGGDRGKPLVEADKFCPITYCKGYGFEEKEKVEFDNIKGIFVYPDASIGFPLETKKGVKSVIENYLPRFYENYSYIIPEAPARWLPGHLTSAWTPLGVTYADQKYNQIPEPDPKFEDPESVFFDRTLDENGNILPDKNKERISHEAIRAIEQMNEERFGCIETEFRAERIRPPSYQLNAHLDSLIGYYASWKYAFEGNRYITFGGCLYEQFCLSSSHYLLDTVSKQIAITAIYHADIFSKEKDENGKLIFDYDNYYKFILLSPDASEDFIQKAIDFAKGASRATYINYREPKAFAVDCRESDEMVKLSTHQ